MTTNSSTSSLVDNGGDGARPGSYYGNGIPYLPIDGYPGKIIAVEGTDGVGRSTQISLLREWLEVQGYGVIETGWTRSELMKPTIELAKASNTLNKLTFVLLYATDFADRLENEMLPALRAGFVVLTDRYIYSAIARAVVRGADPDWMRAIYGIALVPDAVFYLRIRSAEELVTRVLFSGRKFDFWESGMDMYLGEDFHDSFVKYQTRLLREFDRMGGEYGFHVIDSSQTIRKVAAELRRSIARVIDGKTARKARA